MVLATLVAVSFFGALLFFAGRLLASRSFAAQGAALALAAAAGVFFCERHHQDILSGLDSAAYAILADDLRAGVPLAGADSLYSSVPPEIAEAFLYRPRFVAGSPSLRLTRSLAHELREKPEGGFSHRPFYMPAHSMAVAGSRLGRCFMPVAGAFFTALLLLAAIRVSSEDGRTAFGLFPAVAALVVTAYPAWFFRGDYAEAAASVLVLSALASHLAKPFRSASSFAIAGFAVAFSMSFHLTALLLAGPVALLLLFDASVCRRRMALFAGLVAGFAPLWLTTRFLCAPYGDWTRLSMLRVLVFSATEHAAMAGALAVLAALCVAVAALSCSSSLRLRASRLVRAMPFAAWLALAFLPAVLLAFAPGDIGAKFRLALVFGAKSLRAPALLFAAIGIAALYRAPRREILLAVLFAWSACVFLLVFGQESFATHGPATGIWGYRRLLPPVLAFATLFAFAAGGVCGTVPCLGAPSEDGRTAFGQRSRLAIAAFLVFALANPLRSPDAYFAVNGEGAESCVREMRANIDSLDANLVVFDYFPHHVPFAAEGRPVLGLAPHAYGRWPKVADWLAEKAKGGKVWFASSYGLPETEERLVFADPRVFPVERRVVKGKSFLDAQLVSAVATNTLARLVPVGAGFAEPTEQNLSFDGSPVALRGNWTKAGRGGMWSREGAGFAAPLPQPGEAAVVELDVAWTPPEGGPESQLLRIDYPGNPYIAVVKIKSGRHTVKTEFVSEKPLPAVGIYTVSAPRPFDPSQYGMKGYPSDLGAIFLGVRVKLEPIR